MQMIYGSLNLNSAPETEKQNAARMMAALETYPWEAGNTRELTNGAFGLHASAGSPASLPTLAGLTLAADLRLDNRQQLLTELQITNYQLPSLSDSDLLLLAYQKWGTDCAAHLLGDFAFAIWDEPNQRLFCARDFIGARPFYYHCAAGRFVFASDLLALAAHPDLPMELDLAYLHAALQTMGGQFTHTAHTFYRDVEKLPPGHYLTFSPDGLRLSSYWTAGRGSERRYPNERDYVDELRALLNESVACRVRDPNPIGAHITGGLDSSSVAVLAHRILQKEGREVTGFSWAPSPPDNPADMLPNDERKLVEAVRAAEGFPIRYTRLEARHILAHSCRDHSLQPSTTLLHELASSEDAAALGIRTILSGWGGDELPAFNGRGYFSDLFRRGRWLTLQRELTLRGRLQGMSVWKQWIFDGIFPLIPTPVLERLRPEDYPPPPPLPAYLRPGLASALLNARPLTRPEGRERPGVRRMQIALLHHGHLSYRMESWASHGATLGIAYAFPLLDRRVVEFALSIPDDCFFKNGWKRYLYRTAMEGILPDSLRWQKSKEDPAMIQGSRPIHKEVEAQERANLLARADNPFVDVVQLQAALDAEKGGREAIQDDATSPVQRRRLIFKLNAGRARWLAFVNPNAKIPA